MQRHPFDASRSGREPFPCFATAMLLPPTNSEESECAESDGDSDSDALTGTTSPRSTGGCGCACDSADSGRCTSACRARERTPPISSLDWSIDGLATLLPQTFSPLPYQIENRASQHRIRRRRRWSTGTNSSRLVTTPTAHASLLFPTDEAEEETPPRSATFFVDEAQFGVLRTPADVIAREKAALLLPSLATRSAVMAVGVAMASESAYAAWRGTPPESAGRWRELHRRCVDTIQVCEARLRERQQRLARLPIPATKLTLKHRSRRPYDGDRSGTCGTSSSIKAVRATARAERIPREPLTPVVPTRLSFGSIDLSPIPQDSALKTSLQFHDSTPDPKTPTTMRTSHAVLTRPDNERDASAFSSPALSSIAEHTRDVLTPSFASLQFSPSRDFDDENDEQEEKANKENDVSFASSSSSSSLKTLSLLRSSPSNLATPAAGASSSSSSTPSSFVSPSSPPVLLHATDTDRDESESIAARQLSFMAAIEEEAQARDAATVDDRRRRATEASKSAMTTPDDTTAGSSSAASSSPLSPPWWIPLQSRSPAPATSMASIYKEARALGLTEPTAQWEYVQLIRRQTTRTATTITTTMGASVRSAPEY